MSKFPDLPAEDKCDNYIEPLETAGSNSAVINAPDKIKERTIFNLRQLEEVAESLNFLSPARRSRDGSKLIPIHNRKDPDLTLKILIFDLANRVSHHSNLKPQQQKRC